MQDVFAFLKFLVLCIVAMVALFAVLLIVVSLLPRENPLRLILAAFTKRVGVTTATAVVAPPLAAIPVLGHLADFLMVAFTIYYWV